MVTVVPAVLLMVLVIVPEAPIELCHDTTSQLVLLKCSNNTIYSKNIIKSETFISALTGLFWFHYLKDRRSVKGGSRRE